MDSYNTSKHLSMGIGAFILVISMLLGTLLPSFSTLAATSSGSANATTLSGVGGSQKSYGKTNGQYLNYKSGSLPQRAFYNAHSGSWYPKYYSGAKFNGTKAPTTGAFYCIQPAVDVGGTYTIYQLTDNVGNVLYKPNNGAFADQFEGANLDIKTQIQLLRILMMYTSANKPNSKDMKYVAGQALVWEVVMGYRKADWTYVKPKNKLEPKNYGPTGNKSYLTAYDNISNQVKAHIQKYGLSPADGKPEQLPSFAKKTYLLNKNGSSYSVTLTDTNKVLSNYTASCDDKSISIQKSADGNSLTISSSSAPKKAPTITLTSNNKDTNNGILYLLHRKNNQDGVVTIKSPLTTNFKVQAPAEQPLDPLELEIEKKSADGSTDDMSGTVFTAKWYKSGTPTGTPDGEYQLTTQPTQDGKYVASLADATVVSGEDIPTTTSASTSTTTAQTQSPGFPAGSLIVISETTPPENYSGTPKWTITSGTNATVVGDTIQIKIQHDSNNSANASDVKLTAEDSVNPHFDFSTNLEADDIGSTINANEHKTVKLTDEVTIDADSQGLEGATGTLVGEIYDSTTKQKLGTQKQEISNIKPGATYSQKFTADISQYSDTGKSTIIYANETLTLQKDGKNLEGSPKSENGLEATTQQVKINSDTPPVDTPEMHTSLSSSNGGSGTINRSKSTTLSDAVTISGVGDKLKGTTATLTSTLVGPNGTIDTKTQSIQLDNKTISQSFKAFDSTDTAKYPTDKSVYANEKITYKDANGQEQTFEENGEEEESQQVTFPDTPIPALGTTLTNKQTHNQTFTPGGKISLVDTVSYENLTAGESYTLEGTLMDKETQSELKDSSGNPVTGKVTFTASAANGKQDMSFDFNIDANFDHEVVAYETLKDKTGKEIAVHKDINAITQTVTPTPKHETPQISTSVKSKGTGDQLDNATKEVNLVDTVHYSGLEGNTKYVMQGTLMHRSTGTAIQKSGKDLTNTVEFTTTASGTGDVEVPFTFNAKDIQLKGQPLKLAGQDIVVFEKVYKPGTTTIIARHEDRNDTHQIVHFPSGHTNARDAETLTQNSNAGKKVTIKDVVTYNNLIPGKTYTMTGTAYRKDTGKPLTDHGKVVSNTISFTPSSANGSIVVPVTFDASLLQGKRIVMFESCKYRNYEVFVHADINDHDQTIYIPELHTVAANSRDGSHKVGVGNVKIADKVSYTNLIPGQEYTVEGVLMNKDTGKPVIVDGKQVTGTATFTAKQATGYQVVDFKVDTSKIGTKHLVVFETLYTGNHKEVGHHKDIHDEDQAIIVTETVRTGGFPIVPVAVGAGVIVLGAGLYFVFRKKKHPHTTD